MFIKPKKSLGQNFLIDHNVLEQIIDTVQITKQIKKDIPFEERQVLAEDLWSIILADLTRSEDENSFMRTCIKLIGVNDVDSALARRAVMDKIKRDGISE